MKSQSIIVTGGIGYVGRELVRQLVEDATKEVHVIDNLTCGELKAGVNGP